MSGLIARRGTMVKQGGGDLPPSNQIWYDAESQVTLYSATDLISHTFSNGRGVITRGGDLTMCRHWFRKVSTVTAVYLPSVITSFVYNSFESCFSLRTINLPDSLVVLPQSCFSSCTNLVLKSLPSGLTTIEYSALTSCTNLALTSLPSGLTYIGDNAFQRCTSLALTSLPSGITNIGKGSFRYITGITSLTIPIVTPPTLGYAAFHNTSFPIYVPAESVDAYKTTGNWEDYASRIFAIPE